MMVMDRLTLGLAAALVLLALWLDDSAGQRAA